MGNLMILDVKVGDHVLFGKSSGSDTKLFGAEYLIMREADLLVILDSTGEVFKKAI
jgi:chaperonin GroES